MKTALPGSYVVEQCKSLGEWVKSVVSIFSKLVKGVESLTVHSSQADTECCKLGTHRVQTAEAVQSKLGR
jgi:hypothetical protein